MRVYIPATFSTLRGLNESRVITARSGYGFAVTPALLDFYTDGDEEEIAHAAFQDAAEASIRLLAIGDEETFPYRRVVVSVDVDDSVVTYQPENGESVVKLSPAHINLDDVAAIHIDVEASEADTKKLSKSSTNPTSAKKTPNSPSETPKTTSWPGTTQKSSPS